MGLARCRRYETEAASRRRKLRFAMKTMLDRVWEAHEVVAETPDTPAVLFVDRHLIHEVTTPQAFTVLRERGLKVRRPDRTLATIDHSSPTRSDQIFGGVPIAIESA